MNLLNGTSKVLLDKYRGMIYSSSLSLKLFYFVIKTSFYSFKKFSESLLQMWCHENFLNHRNLKYALEVRKQLHQVCQRNNVTLVSCNQDMDALRRYIYVFLFCIFPP